jgi:hypothetical protein
MSKRNEDFSFKFYKKFDVTQLKIAVEKMNHEWDIDTSRQKEYAVHRRTKAYHIYTYPLDWQLYTPYVGKVTCQDDNIFNLVNPIIDDLETMVKGKVGQCVLVKLKAKDLIGYHQDGDDYLMHSRRFHLPVITNDDISFSVGDETKVMGEGECWEINNGKLHAAHNKSTIDRVQLIFDIIPEEFIG